MAVDLANLVDALRRETGPLGTDNFPTATDDDFIGALTDAFWELRLYGWFVGYEEDAAARGGPVRFGPGIVTPTGATTTYDDPDGYSTTDLSRQMQQLIVLWAGWNVVINRLAALNTMMRAKAGNVEYERQNSASTLKALLDHLKDRIDYVLTTVRSGDVTTVTVFDAVVERSYSLASGETTWLRG